MRGTCTTSITRSIVRAHPPEGSRQVHVTCTCTRIMTSITTHASRQALCACACARAWRTSRYQTKPRSDEL
eukprot:2693164-Prymnesium_polylepis.2